MSAPAERLAAALADRYRIERELGAGGMATVYLASDLKHDRKVAIKVLKPELAAVLGAERFVVEIKTTAALSHPHILPLFDSGEAGGFLYYVMPFIEGETIRDRLNRETQLGIDEAVKITTEIADALDYAHRHGVIHRDIKPENILLHDGRAMVMDFGIALAVSAAAGGRMTETGLSLGTPHYMSPEQATAEKEITPRSDIYSLASVLYEMLAGDPPFTASAAQAVIMKIITEPAPAVTARRRNVPANVAAALAKALEKLPADRFESAARFSEALGNPGYADAGSAAARAEGGAALHGVSTRTFAMAVGVAILATGVAAWMGLSRERPEPRPVLRLRAELPDSLVLASGISGSRIATSRDGSVIAYALSSASERVVLRTGQIWYRKSDGADLQPLTPAGRSTQFSLSPDGERIAFWRGNELFVVVLDGGPASPVAGAFRQDAVAWTRSGDIIASDSGGRLVRVPIDGGDAEVLSAQDVSAGEISHSEADPLPNGKGVIFSIAHQPSTNAALRDVAVLDLRTGKHRVLARAVLGRYAASGHLVYVTVEGALMAAPFDQDRLEVTGPAVAIGSGVAVRRNGSVDLALSASGTLHYTSGLSETTAARELVWLTRAGVLTPVDTTWRAAFEAVAISPDGRSLAVGISEGDHEDVWIRELGARTITKLTFEGQLNLRPSWLPDGRRIAFVSNARGAFDLVARRADGIGATEVLADEDRRLAQGFVSRDGKWVVYRTNANDPGQGDIGAFRVGDSVAVPLVATPAEERYPALSPDGRWLAYRSSETNRAVVYVQPFPNVSDGKWPVSPPGGSEPLWSHSGKELFYINSDGEMVAVTLQAQPTFAVVSQQVLFTLPPGTLRAVSHQTFDIAPDDRRFVMISQVGAGGRGRPTPSAAGHLEVVQNWFEELQAKAPVRR